MFRSLGLRHLIVVNTAHAPIGIITRKELQKHFLHIWLDREDERATNALTLESLSRLPTRNASIHEAVEMELGEDFGSMVLQPGDLVWDKQLDKDLDGTRGVRFQTASSAPAVNTNGDVTLGSGGGGGDGA